MSDKLKAVIMAGGEGTRLRPLTLSRPKPLVKIGNDEAMSHILRLLTSHGVTSAGVTLRYLGESIKRRYGDSAFGVDLRYFTEDVPLGTAGGVKAASAILDGGEDLFVVISGDTVCEVDITAALDFHRRSNADATLILTRVDSPYDYGVVLCGDDGRITRFVEKPSPAHAVSDTVNAGIYILSPRVLELIPDGEYDFGRQLFPRMLADGMRIFGYLDGGYWCDVGSLSSYLAANLRMSGGRSVVGRGCKISPSANISRSVILDGAVVEGGASLDGVIVGENAVVGRDVHVGYGAVIGDGVTIGRSSHIAGRTRVYPNIALPENSDVDSDIFTPSEVRTVDKSHGLSAFGYGRAVGGVLGRVALAHDGSDRASLVADIVACGVRTSGGRVIRTESGVGCTRAMAAFAATSLGVEYAVYCSSEDFALVGANGRDADDAVERRIFAAANSSARYVGRLKPPTVVERVDLLYAASLRDEIDFGASLSGRKYAFSDNSCSRIAMALLEERGAICSFGATEGSDVGLDARITLSDDGRDLTFESDGIHCDMRHCAAVILRHSRDIASPVALDCTEPSALIRICRERGLDVTNSSDSQHAHNLWLVDALRTALRMVSLTAATSLRELVRGLPEFFTARGVADTPEASQSRVIRRLREAHFTHDGEGFVYATETARIRVVPRRGRGFVLYAESDSVSGEFASELYADTEKLIHDAE